MATLTRIDAGDVRLDAYSRLTDVPYRSHIELELQQFIIEGLLVLERALEVGIRPRHVLASERMSDRVFALLADVDVELLIASDATLESTTGFHVHRGVLAQADRPRLPIADELLTDANLVLVLEALRDHANVGAAFRNAAALGVDAVIVTKDCADPLYRRSVKTSMGSVLQVPWAISADLLSTVRLAQNLGFEVVALTPAADSVPLSVAAAAPRRRLLLVGTEGAGLTQGAISAADVKARIPMAPGPDSLNVAAATAVSLYAFGPSSANSVDLA